MGWDEVTATITGGAQAFFGDPSISYEPHDAAAFEVTGIFRDAADEAEADVGGELLIIGRTPMVDLRLFAPPPAGLGGRMPERDDRVVVAGKRYEVLEWRPDGEGMVQVDLHEAEE